MLNLRWTWKPPLGAAVLGAFLFGSPLPAAAQDEGGREHEGQSNAEIAQKLANPVSNLWSLGLQNNMMFARGNGHSYRGIWTTNLQPVLPVHLTDDWNLILRPVFNFTSTPVRDDAAFFSGDFRANPRVHRSQGIGQTSTIALISPRDSKTIWGIGPTFIIPTTTREELSQRKYAVGPAAVLLKSSPSRGLSTSLGSPSAEGAR